MSDASDLAALEHARLLHAQLLGRLGKLGLPQASFECIRDRLHDNIEDLTFDARRIHDRAPRQPANAPPWADDTREQKAFEADVAWHRKQIGSAA